MSTVAAVATGLDSEEQKLWPAHRKSGHPRFSILQILCPKLYDGLNIDKLICELVN